MGKETSISWADHSWSPWHGCSKVSAGCQNCYAEAQSHRNPGVLGVWGDHGTRVITAESGWELPLRWNRQAEWDCRRRKAFPSLCDVFEDRPELVEVRSRFFQLVWDTPYLDWLILTKRPQSAPAILREIFIATEWGPWSAWELLRDGDLLNVWFGVSVENQQIANERIPVLQEIPAIIKFLSMEPLLGPINLTDKLDGIDWVIIGGESGPQARPCDLAWIRSLVRQCKDADVPVFIKQLGSYITWMPCDDPGFATREWTKHPKGGNPEEWPKDLDVREFPEVQS